MNILIIGAGKLGLALAKILHNQGHKITTLSRTPKPVPVGITHLCQDIHTLDVGSLGVFDWVYVILTPSQRSPVGYIHTYVESIRPIFESLDTKRLVYVSSTQVYGQDNGEVVDNHTPPMPASEYGNILYAAELIWRSLLKDNLIIIRPSGIIKKDIFENADNHFAKIAKTLDKDSSQFSSEHWLNLVYQDTIIDSLAALPTLKTPEPAYIISDISILRHNFYNNLRALQGLEVIPIKQELPTTGKRLITTPLLSHTTAPQKP